MKEKCVSGLRTGVLALCVLLTVASGRAQEDSAAYRAATALSSPAEKIDALEKFVAAFPRSKLLTRAYDTLFDLHVEQGNEPAALAAAHGSLESVPPGNRMNPYNRIAYRLALKGMGLDSALAYIDRGIVLAGTSRSLSGFQDTKAYVLYKLGRFAEAEELQRVAIKGHEDDQEFLGHLAMFEKANGKPRDALRTMSRALYFDGEQELKQMFLTWLDEAERDGPKREALKKAVVMETVRSIVDTMKGAALIAQRSRAATLMADLAVDLPTAKKWAEAAVKSLSGKSSIDDVIAFKQSLALVLAAQSKPKEALGYLTSIEMLVSPYDARFWLALGNVYEQLAESRKAIAAYLSGLVPRNEPRLRSAAEPLFVREYSADLSMDKVLDSLRQLSGKVPEEHYNGKATPNGKVILAELFTGAECGPCVSSDLAFDALAEYYPRTAVAILEYHVHIPGPDPMTTNETWERYNWYVGQGTPTVLIDGREMIVGGGPRTVTRNRYGVYRYAIGKVEAAKPGAQLDVAVNADGDEVRVEVQVSGVKNSEAVAVHVALVERSVAYTGANGIDKHAYVVRKLFAGSGGTPVTQPRQKLSTNVNVAGVEREIKEYLDDPTRQPSWPRGRAFSSWRARPEKIDRANLAVVVWVQDMRSKEVLQAAFRDVPAPASVN